MKKNKEKWIVLADKPSVALKENVARFYGSREDVLKVLHKLMEADKESSPKDYLYGMVKNTSEMMLWGICRNFARNVDLFKTKEEKYYGYGL